jgi:hypothetical protein
MRRIGIPVALALAATALVNPVTPAAARTPLSVQPYCWINDWGSFACHAVTNGGTGSYVSYTWTISEGTEPHRYTYQKVTSSENLAGTCTVTADMVVAVTVKDSGGATAASNSGVVFNCSELIDETPQWPSE